MSVHPRGTVQTNYSTPYESSAGIAKDAIKMLLLRNDAQSSGEKSTDQSNSMQLT